MKQLARCKWHQQPATPPPRLPFKPSLILKRVVGKLGRSGRGVDRHRDPKLIARIHAQSKASETGSYGRGQPRCEGLTNSRITSAESGGVLGEQIETETGEESVKDAVEQEYKG